MAVLESEYTQCSGLIELIERAGAILGSSEKPEVTPLLGGGSDKQFFRIFCGSSSLIGLVSPRSRKNSIDHNDSYLLIGNHLYSKGLPVPRILFADTASGKFLLEDAGDSHLQRFANVHRTNIEAIYNRVVRMLGALHIKASRGFDPGFCFDSAIYDASFVYERELEYFRKSFVNGYLGLEIAAEEIRADFEAVAELAGVRESSFVFHRDFQSRNIMVRGARLWLIDFQGMRFGPPAYDLASLLIDPYVRMPEGLENKLVSLYWSCAGKQLGISGSDFLKKFEAVRLARNLQILGAFGFLGVTKGKTLFLKYIPVAFEQLVRNSSFSFLKRFTRLEKLVSVIRRHRLGHMVRSGAEIW